MSAGGRQRAGASPRLRNMVLADVDTVLEMEQAAFPSIPEDRRWERHQLIAHVTRFPEGQFIAELDGRIVGSCTNFLTTHEAALRHHTWNEITAQGTLDTHDPEGDVLYGTEIMVHPDARRRGVGRRLVQARFDLVRRLGLRGFVTGGRLPGYRAHVDEMKPQEYVDAVTRGELTDPVLTPELKWGFRPRGVLCGYIFDPGSVHTATLVVWENPDAPEGIP